MRIVFDTNVLLAAFISHGTCTELFEHCVPRHTLITSEFILKEFQRHLLHKFKQTVSQVSGARHLLTERMIRVEPIQFEQVVCERDSDDDQILGTALAGNCHCLVTGDKDLLDLKKFRGIDIILPSFFWKYEEHR